MPGTTTSTPVSPLSGTHIDTSIVLATCSRAVLLRDALSSLLLQSWDDHHAIEIIVVDDGSTDDTPALLAEFQRNSPIPFQILQGPSLGVAAARNLGCEHARGTWLASFDDDQIALPGWLRALRELADETGAACVGGALALMLPEGVGVQSVGPRARRVLGEHLLGDMPKRYSGDPYPATNNVLIRRDLFVSLGGYDVSFTEGGEDKDFFNRAAAAGQQMWFQPLSPGLHIMTPQRLQNGNLRWTSLRLGASDARVRRHGHVVALLRLVAVRACVTMLRDLPALLWAKLRGNRRDDLDVRCSLWYSEGLMRALPSMMTRQPKDSAFLRSIDFRSRNGERNEATRRVDPEV
jgi:GT2 family glycosyltransferase